MSIGRLIRKLDHDLIAKIRNGWKPHSEAKPLKRQRAPRDGSSYRGARRNACLRPEPPGKPGVWGPAYYYAG